MRNIFFFVVLMFFACEEKKPDKEQIASLKTVPITTHSERAKEHFIKARYLVQNGFFGDDAYQHFDEAIQLDSTFVRMYNYLSVYRANDSIKRANHELAKKYRHLASKEEQMLVDAAEYRFNNPNDSLERILFDVAKLCPDDKYLHQTICFLLIYKNPKLAIEAGERAIEIDSNYAGGYNNLGYAYINNGDFIKAEATFDKYIEVHPDKGNPYDSKADLMMKLNRYEEAFELKTKAYSIDTNLYWIPEELPYIKAKIDSIQVSNSGI